ncbi:MAG: tryptophan synthase subunit alpha [Acidaminococcaceae bacterium]|nr:tryptophan synthase subunit alpha [Acidaminococcaceae bacterium]
MSKLAGVLKQHKKIFAPFITAGDPDLETTKKLILAMEEAGATLVELGIPFSDPMAEGPVIQEADLRALSAGCTTDKVFDMIREVRKETDIPLVFLTYANPIFHYGTDKFYARCAEVGVDGTIVPDVPYEEREELEAACEKYGVDRITMIAPTSEDRIQEIARDAKGYVYIVSSLGVTGVRSEITTDIGTIYRKIREVTDTPAAVGFGISTPKQAAEMARLSDGAIVGSAIVKIVAEYGRDCVTPVKEYVKSMVDAVNHCGE